MTDAPRRRLAARQPGPERTTARHRHRRALGLVFAGPITRLVVSGEEFAAVPGKIELTALLTRIMLPFLTTVAVAAAMMGMLNSLRRFFIPALSPAMFNVATIFCAFAVVPLMPRDRPAADRGDRHRHAAGRPRHRSGVQWPLAPQGRASATAPSSTSRIRICAQILRLMGPGDPRVWRRCRSTCS